MKRVVGCLLLIACHGGASSPAPARTPSPPPERPVTAPPPRPSPPEVVVAARDVSQPQPPAVFAGTIRDAAGKPVAGALACATFESAFQSKTTCAEADASGAYRLEVTEGSYTMDASAHGYLPAPIRRDGASWIEALPGGRIDGLDAVLDGGAVEISGTVTDAAGAPIAGAQVGTTAGWGRFPGVAVTRTDAAGKYSLWTRGDVRVWARAPGYDPDGERLIAPGTADLRLQLASAIEGTVVDDTGTPLAGIRVDAAMTGTPMRSSFSDARGAFRITDLGLGRYTVMVHDAGYVSMPAPSFAARAGETVRGERVVVVPARRVASKVTIIETGKPCAGAAVILLRDGDTLEMKATAREDGTVVFDSMPPGTYKIRVNCPDLHTATGYPDLVVADSDLSNLEWQVPAGTTISGRVRRAGRPVAGVIVGTRNAHDRWEIQTARTRADGSYTIAGLLPETYYLDVMSDDGALAKEVEVVVKAKPIVRDLALVPALTVAGRVVDEKQAPVARLEVTIEAADAARTSWRKSRTVTAADGTFEFRGLPPGSYTASVRVPWAAREATHPSTKITAATRRPATLPTLVVASPSAAIRGIVLDARGAPVRDAKVSSSTETSYTAADGTFVLERVSPDPQRVSATRDDVVFAEQKDVPAGGTVRLQLPEAGQISGVIQRADGTAVDAVDLEVTGPMLMMIEPIGGTGGRFVLRDLAPGSYNLTVRSPVFGTVAVDVAPGQRKTGVQILLK